MSIHKRIREIEALGWRVVVTKGNQLRCEHQDAKRPVFASLTPGDRRWMVNLKAKFDRVLREGKERLEP